MVPKPEDEMEEFEGEGITGKWGIQGADASE
jgi:hypothetical protein